MAGRASLWIRVGWMVLSLIGSMTLMTYVDQQRSQVIGFCPPISSAGRPAVMIYDTRTGKVWCSPLPITEKGVIDNLPRSEPKQES